MKKRLLSSVSLLLALLMILSALVACTPEGDGEKTTTEKITDSEGAQSTETGETEETADHPATDTESEAGTEGNTETHGETETEAAPLLEGEHALLIENANALKNKITAYFSDSNRKSVVFENLEMTLDYGLSSADKQQVNFLKNKKGASYVENTMDVFVRMTDGKTYYASDSSTNGIFNIYRFGYYFYEMRVEEQDFTGTAEILGEKKIDFRRANESNSLASVKYEGGVLKVKNDENGLDPWLIISRKIGLSAEDYTILEITMKADAKARANAQLFFIAGSQKGFNSDQSLNFSIIADGEYHTYRIPLYTGYDYTGTFNGLRLDVDGAGASYEISAIRALKVDTSSVPSHLSMARIFNVYSDKMHQKVQIAALKETKNISAVGILTEIPQEKVAKLVIKDKQEQLHTSLEGVDWQTVEYIGFDIVDAGIFGYILPYDGKGGQLSVTLADGKYVVEQTMIPDGGVIKPSRGEFNEMKEDYDSIVPDNGNDFYMGSRVYTDDSHDFEEFLHEAYCERNPLSEKNVKIVEDSSIEASFAGYDSLRGIYRINMAGPRGGFNTSYYSEPNKHYRVNFTLRGDELNRMIYAMTCTSAGTLECAALLDKNDVMLPMPLEVGKNFSEAYGTGERNLYNIQDISYGEVIFPMVIEAKQKYEYTVLNLYHNWGNYLLKQISWIQFYAPYYHLSTGVTETNCVLPWTFTKIFHYNTLPDFRTMSAPFWSDQPQHPSAGQHYWLKYTDSEGNLVRAENIYNTVDSFGPTYADVKMDYISHDGKIKVSYVHSEMPQTDENRTFYEMSYEVLEDVTIKDFAHNFQFYSVDPNDPSGYYKRLGYLNERNESVIVDANENTEPVKYVLGDNCPYVSFFDMENWSSESQQGYTNLAILIDSAEFIIGGEKVTPRFAVLNNLDQIVLTLDLGDVTLKAGDRFTVNAIFLPWGSHLLSDGIVDAESGNYEYTMELPDGSLYMDKNVRDVRENTLLNSLKITAGADTEVVESVFIPKVKTTNGETAEFTLSGAYNNVAVRAYGFDLMTVPVIYEKVNGEWKLYDVSSRQTKQMPHAYDGYCIYYDGDGTFSYSFVTTMDGENSRTFRIVADGSYEKWSKETFSAKTRPDYLDIYVDHVEFAENNTGTMLSNQYIGSYELVDTADEQYVRLYGYGPDSKEGEGYVYVYSSANGDVATGSLMALKYRIPNTNKESIRRFEFYVSTEEQRPQSNDGMVVVNAIADGEWHTLVVDLSKVESSTFGTQFINRDGKYAPLYVRWDFFNSRMSPETCVDFGFFGMNDSLEEILTLCKDMSFVTLVEGKAEHAVDPMTGESSSTTPKLPEKLVNSDQFTESNLPFGAHIDFINGAIANLGAGSGHGISAINLFGKAIADDTIADGALVDGANLVASGWLVVEGGVNKYVWSADGGVTWQDVSFYNLGSYRSLKEGEEHVGVASNRANGHIFTYEDGINCKFPGTASTEPCGISADLSAYVGKTVDVIFAAVPESAPSTVCPFLYVGKVTVKEQPSDAMTKEEKAQQEKEKEENKPLVYNAYVKEGSGYSVSDLPYASSVDMINARGENGADVFRNFGGNTLKGIQLYSHNGGTVDGAYLVVTGWTAVNGGVEKYVWSVDGGKTWQDVVLHQRSSFGEIGELHVSVANGQIQSSGALNMTATPNSLYGSGIGLDPDDAAGIAADLSTYAGETVDVIFAAVPAKDTDTLCLIICISGVQVAN